MNKIILSACLIFVLPSVVHAETFYIRTDGGSPRQCLGTTDAPYPGKGYWQACAWNHPFYAWGWVSGEEGRIREGDTVIIGSPGDDPGEFDVGYDAGWNGCTEVAAYDCKMRPTPSQVKILGRGYEAGCSGKKAQLWGKSRVSAVLDLSNDEIEVQCLDITDHSSCIEFGPQDGTVGNDPVQCHRDAPPYGDWAAIGIFAANRASDIKLKDVAIHGLAHAGIMALNIGDWELDNVAIVANGWLGWDSDGPGEDSYSGTVNLINSKIEWNGCGEKYPLTNKDLSSADDKHHCWSQSQGGYGDGIGLGDGTTGNWNIIGSSVSWNTSDGIDLLHGDGSGTVVISRSKVEGNAGQAVKVLAAKTYLENSVIVGNCGFHKAQPFTSTKANNGQPMAFDTCRAMGDTIAFAIRRPDQSFRLTNSTVVGNGNVLLLSAGEHCDGQTKFIVRNSILVGGSEFNDDPVNNAAGSGELSAFYYASGANGDGSGSCGSLKLDEDYNLIFNTLGGSKDVTGRHSHYRDPLFTSSLKLGSGKYENGLDVADRLSRLDPKGPASGPQAADESVELSVYGAADFLNQPRGAIWTAGAYQLSPTGPKP